MRKLVLILGIFFLIAAVILLALSGLSHMGYYNAMDASGEYYDRMYRNFKLYLFGGIGSLICGAVLLIIRARVLKPH